MTSIDVRYVAGRDGINSLESPGELVTVPTGHPGRTA
jgi:hypothetical protein